MYNMSLEHFVRLSLLPLYTCCFCWVRFFCIIHDVVIWISFKRTLNVKSISNSSVWKEILAENELPRRFTYLPLRKFPSKRLKSCAIPAKFDDRKGLIGLSKMEKYNFAPTHYTLQVDYEKTMEKFWESKLFWLFFILRLKVQNSVHYTHYLLVMTFTLVGGLFVNSFNSFTAYSQYTFLFLFYKNFGWMFPTFRITKPWTQVFPPVPVQRLRGPRTGNNLRCALWPRLEW